MSTLLRLIRVDGREEVHQVPPGKSVLREVERLIGADALDSFSLRNGYRVWVDDNGGAKNLPLNRKATALYHTVCIPGTVHEIVGDVAMLKENA